MKKTVNVRSMNCPEELWEEACRVAQIRGSNCTTISSTVQFILKDYANMVELFSMKNPLLLMEINETQKALMDQFEKKISSKIFRLMSEQAIETSILGQLLFNDICNNMSPYEVRQLWNQLRGNAIEQFKNKGSIMSYKEYLEKVENNG